MRRLLDQGMEAKGLGFDEARRILWMYTSRDVYRMLVREGGWTPDHWQAWLSDTMVKALVEPRPTRVRGTGYDDLGTPRRPLGEHVVTLRTNDRPHALAIAPRRRRPAPA